MFHMCCKHFYVVVELFGVGDYNSIDFLDSFDGRATRSYLLEAAGFSKCELGAKLDNSKVGSATCSTPTFFTTSLAALQASFS